MDKNEAIKIIRSNFPTGRKMLCEALEILIPELKESEDERIRKALKSFFDSEISDYGNVEWRNGIRYGEIVTWLEKQGEQKPAWSEEDKLKMDTLIHVITNQKGSAIFEGLLPEELVNWLKSLKERMKGE